MAQTKYKSAKRSVPARHSKKLWWLVAGIALVAVVMVILELTNTTYIFHKQKAVSGTIPSSNPAVSKYSSPAAANSTASASASQAQDTATSKTPASAGSNGPLVAPYGTFVSNHNPSLSNTSSAPSAEESTCNTTVGASCTITFTNSDGVVKTLDAETADSNGTVIWNWDINNKPAFIPGTWQINVTATLNGQSKSTADPTALTVSP